MKRMNLMAVIAIFAIACSNGCLTTKKEVKEPTIKPEAKTNELVIEDIEVIEKNDTTGRVTAAKEAAAKLIADAKQRSLDLTRDAANVFEVKKFEAERNAEKIINAAKAQAEKEKEKILKAALAEKKAIAEKTTQSVLKKTEITAQQIKDAAKTEVAKLLETRKKQSETIAKKIVENAKKSAADMTKTSYQNIIKAKKDSDQIITKANAYAEEKKKEADSYLSKKMAEADKAVAELNKKKEKEQKAAGAVAPAVPAAKDEIIAQNLVDTILKAIPKNDYTVFSKDFTVDLKQRFTKEKFLETNKTLDEKLGELSSLSYLGFIRKGPLVVYMWKANFKKTPKDNDLMVRLTLGELDGKLQVFAFDIAIL